MSDISIPHKTNGIHTVVYSPAAIVSIINAHLSIREEKRSSNSAAFSKKPAHQATAATFTTGLKMKLPTIK